MVPASNTYVVLPIVPTQPGPVCLISPQPVMSRPSVMKWGETGGLVSGSGTVTIAPLLEALDDDAGVGTEVDGLRSRDDDAEAIAALLLAAGGWTGAET